MARNRWDCAELCGAAPCRLGPNYCRYRVGPMGPPGPIGPVGPTGRQGPACATILGSYDTYAELIAAHPTGNIGDAYLAGGVLYVWGGTPASWQNMGSLIGPAGPQGPAGATILGSYDTYAELIAAHPTGNTGDAYLAGGVLYVWGGDPASWQNMGSLIGPAGPQGPAGATILGSYDTYAEFVAAHPTGNTGDAYLAGGDLYVWGGDPASWQNMGSLIGPAGPQGPAGATILDSYDTYEELIAAHPTGNTGDAYLAGGDLYVWGGDPASWQNMGSLIGPEGPQGPAGTTILDSYDTYAALIAAHPTGNTGDAYLAGGDLYVWGGDPASWQNMGSLIGPAGPQGPAGATILDSYDTYAALIAAHPTGNTGDAYLAGGDLYVWGGDPASWQNMGSLIGPAGPQGETGAVGTILDSYDSLQDLTEAHPTGSQGDAYLVDGMLYVWDTENNTWKPVGNLRAPTPESRTIIPFASTVAPNTSSLNGSPTRVSLLGFGYGDGRNDTLDLYSIAVDTSDGHFDLDEDDDRDNHQLVFSLPFDMTIKSLVLTCGNWQQWEFPSTVYPYVQLYAAEPTSNSFRVINGAAAIPEEGIGPGTTPRGTMRFALTEDLDISLSAGTRIAIGALMRTVPEAGTIGTESYWLYFTGSIGLAYIPE